MYLRHISLYNFRNYRKSAWKPLPGINYITGENAQGKTNLIEAIYRILTGGSFRTSRDREMIRWDNLFFRLETLFYVESLKCEINLGLLVNIEGKKQFKVNGLNSPADKINDLPGAVVFSPEDLTIAKGSPQERRRWMDQDLGSLVPGYHLLMRHYQRVLSQRNILLREVKNKRQPLESLFVWDQQLCEYGGGILFKRLETLSKLTPRLRKMYSYLTGEREELSLTYLSSLRLEKNMSLGDICNIYKDYLDRSKQEEINRMQTIYGPHRDDINFFINGAGARQFGSQGQQRTLVLALKLAQLELCREEFKEYPLLLMDDVLMELDITRQRRLMEWIDQRVQVFITTSAGLRQEMLGERAKVIIIKDGSVLGEE